MRRRTLAVAILMLAAGCDTGPRAPALVTESVFVDAKAGVRFAVPDGWVISGRTVPPDGPFDRPMRLASYIRPGGSTSASFDVYLIDLPADKGLRDYLIASPIGAEKWQWPASPDPTTVAGTAASKWVLTARNLKREVVSVDRANGRRLVFLTTAAATDDKALDQARQAVATVGLE